MRTTTPLILSSRLISWIAVTVGPETIEPGDSLSFYAIPRSDWRMLEEAAEAGEWIAELVIADGVAA